MSEEYNREQTIQNILLYQKNIAKYTQLAMKEQALNKEFKDQYKQITQHKFKYNDERAHKFPKLPKQYKEDNGDDDEEIHSLYESMKNAYGVGDSLLIEKVLLRFKESPISNSKFQPQIKALYARLDTHKQS